MDTSTTSLQWVSASQNFTGANTKALGGTAAPEPAGGPFAAAMAGCVAAESNAADAGGESAEGALGVDVPPEDELTTSSLPRRGKGKPASGEPLPSSLLALPGATVAPLPLSVPGSPVATRTAEFTLSADLLGTQAGATLEALPPSPGNPSDELSAASPEALTRTSPAPLPANLLAAGEGMASLTAAAVKRAVDSAAAVLAPDSAEQALALPSLTAIEPATTSRGSSAGENSATARGGAIASGLAARGDAAATPAAYGGGMANGAGQGFGQGFGQSFGQGADAGRGSGSGALDDDALLAMASAGRAAKAEAAGASGPLLPFLHGGATVSGTGGVASPVAGAVAVPVGSGGFADALADEVRVLVDPAVGNGLRSATLKLNPEHLGPLEVRVSVHEQQANIAFTAQHAATREALDAALPRLRETLAQQGFVQVNLDVGGRGSELAQQGQAQGEAPQSRGERGMAAFGAVGAAVDAAPAIRTRRAGVHAAGRFDGYA